MRELQPKVEENVGMSQHSASGLPFIVRRVTPTYSHGFLCEPGLHHVRVTPPSWASLTSECRKSSSYVVPRYVVSSL
jgi:hypothetical protein